MFKVRDFVRCISEGQARHNYKHFPTYDKIYLICEEIDENWILVHYKYNELYYDSKMGFLKEDFVLVDDEDFYEPI